MRRKRLQITAVQAYLSHFRAPFWQALRPRLAELDVDLRLLYGESEGHWSRELEWAEPFKPKALPGGATWYPVLSNVVWNADVVIVEDASRHLLNYLLLALRILGGPKLVVWGHGWNHQTRNPGSLRERLKRFVGARADRFFAYTTGVREGLIERGYKSDRIHVVQNSIEPPSALPDEHTVEQLRNRLGLSADAEVIIYCGQMYPLKHLDLLVDAAELVKKSRPRFELILAGAGPTQDIAETAAQRLPFVRYVGPIFGFEKATYFALSRAYVLSGLVGLGIVDAFHHNLPPIVTNFSFHSPEIDYLRHENNGLLTEHDARDLASGISRLLGDPGLHTRLVDGCKASSRELSIDAMVDGFVSGILSFLDADKANQAFSYE